MSAESQWHKGIASKVEIAVGGTDNTITIALEGELDLAEQEAVRDAMLEVLSRRPAHLILDLSRLNFIDSSGVHVLIEAGRRTAEQDTELRIVPGPPSVQRVFEICNLTDWMPSSRSVTALGAAYPDLPVQSLAVASAFGI